jgi:predicted phage terminase large subunit-like protein
VVDDLVTVQGPPHEVEAAVQRTAEADGKSIPITIPQDPGQAGLAQVQHYQRMLDGWSVIPKRPDRKKELRWGPVSSQVGARNVALVRAPWNAALVAEGHAAPDGPHDDILDALADAHAELSERVTVFEDSGQSYGAGHRRGFRPRR